jgi:hypothetical protein
MEAFLFYAVRMWLLVVMLVAAYLIATYEEDSL